VCLVVLVVAAIKAIGDLGSYVEAGLVLAVFIMPPVVFCAVVAQVLSDEGAVRSTSPAASRRSDALRVVGSADQFRHAELQDHLTRDR
jgi:hypothetical protein